MSELIKHECGIALIRLLRPLEYYNFKYGSWMHALNKMYLLMEKQHNRGQDGAGIACVKFDTKPGMKYINRVRSNKSNPIKDVFAQIRSQNEKHEHINKELLHSPVWAKENLPFAAEVYLGHLRYGTFGRNNIENVHPVLRANNWKTKSLALAGNFNLTNVDELFNHLIELGQHPKDYSDTVTILEKIGHFLDRENEIKFRDFKDKGYQNIEISDLIAQNMDIAKVLSDGSKKWDGGYVIGGLIGSGDAFVMRDPWGIRPASYYYDDEFAVIASERAVIQTVMNVPQDKVKEITPGHAVIIRKSGEIEETEIRKPEERRSCSFERIYFSRGSDADIYSERKKLGEFLVPAILKSVKNDYENTVFSYIPNTAEASYYGLMRGLERHLVDIKRKKINELGDVISNAEIDKILSIAPRTDKIAIKDVKLRTFITDDSDRDDMVAHVYDVTYGTVREGVDNLVVIDDSIVRGTTLKQSILRILDRLGPKKIVIVSSAPQIRYPDCYGIDMAKMGDFIAFRAAIALLKDQGKESIINEVYRKCKSQENAPKEEIVNYVKEIYAPFTAEQISNKIAQKLTKNNKINAKVEIVYQSIEDLHHACPNDKGDWYFTGNYPTPGGNKVVNKSFINYIEGNSGRAY